MTGRVPIRTEPIEGESWDSYLTRCAASNHTSLRAVATAIGHRQEQRWPPFHGVVLTAARCKQVATALDLSLDQLQSMQLAHFDGRSIDLAGLAEHPTLRTTQAATRRAWVRFTGSRYCPRCLEQDNYWQSAWRLPWITTCLIHRLQLRDRCPACGQTSRTNRGGIPTSAPIRSGSVPDPRLCTQTLPGQYGQACLNDLSRATAVLASQNEMTLATTIANVLTVGDAELFGDPHPALVYFSTWQRLICYYLALTRSWNDNAPYHRPWLKPPVDASAMNSLLDATYPAMTANNTTTAAELLGRWSTSAISAPTSATFRDAAPDSPVLQPVIDAYLQTVGRGHTQLRRRRVPPAQQPIWQPLTTAQLPQLCWPCGLPAVYRDRTRPGANLLCAVMSLILARIAGATTWAGAGSALGWPVQRATQWTRYVFATRFEPLRQDLVRAGAQLATLLDSAPAAWAERPALSGTTRTLLANAQQGYCARITPATSEWCPCSRNLDVDYSVTAKPDLTRPFL